MTRYALCVRAFPRDWRERYGEELARLLAESEQPWRERRDLVRAGLAERTRGPHPALVRRAGFALPAALAAAALVPAALAPGVSHRLTAPALAAAPVVAVPLVTPAHVPAGAPGQRRLAVVRATRPVAAPARPAAVRPLAAVIAVRRVARGRTLVVPAPRRHLAPRSA